MMTNNIPKAAPAGGGDSAQKSALIKSKHQVNLADRSNPDPGAANASYLRSQLKVKGPILQDRLRSADKKDKDRKELAHSNSSRNARLSGAKSGSNSKLAMRPVSPSGTDAAQNSQGHLGSVDKTSQDDRSTEEPTPRIQSLAQLRDQKKSRASNKVLHQEDAGGLESRLAAIVTQLDQQRTQSQTRLRQNLLQ